MASMSVSVHKKKYIYLSSQERERESAREGEGIYLLTSKICKSNKFHSHNLIKANYVFEFLPQLLCKS